MALFVLQHLFLAKYKSIFAFATKWQRNVVDVNGLATILDLIIVRIVFMNL